LFALSEIHNCEIILISAIQNALKPVKFIATKTQRHEEEEKK